MGWRPRRNIINMPSSETWARDGFHLTPRLRIQRRAARKSSCTKTAGRVWRRREEHPGIAEGELQGVDDLERRTGIRERELSKVSEKTRVKPRL